MQFLDLADAALVLTTLLVAVTVFSLSVFRLTH